MPMAPFAPLIALCLPLQVSTTGGASLPAYSGDPEAEALLASWMEGAIRSTEAFGPWPPGPWTVRLNENDEGFEQATGAPPGRFATWVDSTLHLRPWRKLQRRDLGALLRHELTHRRLAGLHLPRWKEEATCLWAEGHTHPPANWPPDPEPAIQKRLDAVLQAGTTASQRWAYAWLRAWLNRQPLPNPPGQPIPQATAWQAEISQVTVAWPPERLPRAMVVNGQEIHWQLGSHFHFEGEVRFGPGMPVSQIEGEITLDATQKGWRLTWATTPETWIAAAMEGELGSEAPFEAKRALASVLRLWLKAHPSGNHPDGTFCPLTHCAVIRGQPTPEGLQAVAQAPVLDIALDRALFTGSKGGVSWSPREVWGRGSTVTGSATVIPEDPWATWTRHLSAAQVRALKASVKPGLGPGQRGLRLGPSGPYPVEALRLEAGRRFGWTVWPSNACEAEMQPDGSLVLNGHGWGHNAGLCLATAIFRAKQGDRAEVILQEAFGVEPP